MSMLCLMPSSPSGSERIARNMSDQPIHRGLPYTAGLARHQPNCMCKSWHLAFKLWKMAWWHFAPWHGCIRRDVYTFVCPMTHVLNIMHREDSHCLD